MPAYSFLSGYLTFHFSLTNLYIFSFFTFLSFVLVECLFYIFKTSRSKKDRKSILYFSIPAFILGCIFNMVRYEPMPDHWQGPNQITMVFGIPKKAGPANPIVFKYSNGKIKLVGLNKQPDVYGNYVRGFRCTVLDRNQPINIYRPFKLCLVKDLVITKDPASVTWFTDRFKDYDLAAAIFLSRPSELNNQVLFAARQLGIAHLFAASGLHLGILFISITWLFKKLRLRNAEIIGLSFCFLYSWLLGFPVSLNRAFIFALVYTLGKLFSVEVYFPSLLTFSACIVEVLFPGSLFSFGFLFSFAVTAAIVGFHHALTEILTPLPGYLRTTLAIQLSAGIAAAPLSYFLFSQYSVFSLFLNLILIPFIPFVLIACWLHCLVPIGFVLSLMESLTLSIVKYFFHLDNQLTIAHSDIHFPLILLGAFLCAFPSLIPGVYRAFYLTKLRWLLLFSFLPLFNLQYASSLREIFTMPGRTLSIVSNKGFIQEINNRFIQQVPYVDKLPLHLKWLVAPESEVKIIKEALPFTNVKSQKFTNQSWITLPGENCVLFYSFLDPGFFKQKVISSCKAIYLVHPKTNTPNKKEWLSTLRRYGFSGKLELVLYYQKFMM